jgi:phage baseplate assembly protein W
MAVKISRAFKDISLSFSRHPVTNDVTVLKNQDAIKKSVINLCRTKFNERFFNDLIGTSVDDSLFELIDSGIGDVLEREIEALLNNFEPRIDLSDINVIADPDSNSLEIKVTYQIVGLPLPQQNIEFLLQPTRV